jgi:hypothetical protein
MSDTEPLVYSLDERDRIVRVNDAWTRFARENDAPELAAEQVLQRSIWDFLDDPTTRQIYTHLVSRVRQGRTVCFSLRCDSPTLRRHLKMVVTPADRNYVDFQSVVVAVEPRPIQRIWDRRTIRSGTLLRACAWCKRVEVGGEWMEIEVALEPLRIFEMERLPALTHGICDACHRTMTIVMSLGRSS